MLNISTQIIHLHKRFPLAISRGVMTGSDNLFIHVEENGVTGIGEMAPGSTEGAQTPQEGAKMRRVIEILIFLGAPKAVRLPPSRSTPIRDLDPTPLL